MTGTRRTLQTGQTLYTVGDAADCAWIIESGEIGLHLDPSDDAANAVFRPGDMLGELSALEGGTRITHAVARAPTTVIAVERAQFIERLDNSDSILRALVDGLLRRAHRARGMLSPALAAQVEEAPGDGHLQLAGIGKMRQDADLRDALAARQLDVRYQPIYDVTRGVIANFEALVRWEPPGLPAVSPGKFVALAEETSLIVPVGEYVLDEVCGVLAQLHRQHPDGAAPVIAVNLSAYQLIHPGMVERILERVRRAGFPAHMLKLEITESRMLDYQVVRDVMAQCRENGLQFALDDFGTGYSNLTHLHALDFEYVKIDQAFARRMLDSARAMRIVEAIVGMAHAIGAEVIMEGIETAAQLAELQRLGVRYAQGYWIGQAQSAAAVLSGTALQPVFAREA